jgi:F-type H+-transporting ATPase subunit gamma
MKNRCAPWVIIIARWNWDWARAFAESKPVASNCKTKRKNRHGAIGAVVFGSDQGLVGQFNDVVADYAVKTLAALPGKPEVWAVGERVQARLTDAGLKLMGLFPCRIPFRPSRRSSGRFKSKAKRVARKANMRGSTFFTTARNPARFTSRSASGYCRSTHAWQKGLAKVPWPTKILPEVMCSDTVTCARSSANIFSSRFFGRARIARERKRQPPGRDGTRR